MTRPTTADRTPPGYRRTPPARPCPLAQPEESTMTTPPQMPDPRLTLAPPAAALHSQALAAAVSYVLDGAASLIAGDGDTVSAGLLEGGAEAAWIIYDLPGHAAPAVYRRASFYLARTSGYQPPGSFDPVIDRALDELAAYPAERQIRLLSYAARP